MKDFLRRLVMCALVASVCAAMSGSALFFAFSPRGDSIMPWNWIAGFLGACGGFLAGLLAWSLFDAQSR